MQYQRADQSPFYRKGVCDMSLCYWSFSGHKNTSILIRDGKDNQFS